jgi:hypothetical protein
MQSRSWIAWVADATVLAWSTVVAAVQEPLVTFSNIFDVVPGRFFDANPKFTKPDPDNGNKLLIGFSPGFDATTFTVNEFTASTAAFYHAFAMDTISFLIEAPKDYYIARIIYTQTGTYTVSRTARAAVGVHWVVDGLPADLGRDEKTNFGLINTDPNLSSMIDLTGQNKSRVQVSITCSLFAFAPPMVTSATISIRSAEVLVELYPAGQ